MDTFHWGSTAGDLLRAVPEDELTRLTSLRPRLRAVLASDRYCSGPAMLLLTGDTDRVRRALAANPAAGPRVKELLWAIEFAAWRPPAPASAILRLLGRSPAPDEPYWGFRLPASPKATFMLDRFIGDPDCRPELLRALWRDEALRRMVAHHPKAPEDLLDQMLSAPDAMVRGVAARRLVSGRERRLEIILAAVCDAGNGLSAHERERLLHRLSDDGLHAAARDPDPALRPCWISCPDDPPGPRPISPAVTDCAARRRTPLVRSPSRQWDRLPPPAALRRAGGYYPIGSRLTRTR